MRALILAATLTLVVSPVLAKDSSHHGTTSVISTTFKISQDTVHFTGRYNHATNRAVGTVIDNGYVFFYTGRLVGHPGDGHAVTKGTIRLFTTNH